MIMASQKSSVYGGGTEYGKGRPGTPDGETWVCFSPIQFKKIFIYMIKKSVM